MFGVLGGNREVVKLLLEKGADVKARTSEGDTALMIAVESGKIEMVELLIEKGAYIEGLREDGLSRRETGVGRWVTWNWLECSSKKVQRSIH